MTDIDDIELGLTNGGRVCIGEIDHTNKCFKNGKKDVTADFLAVMVEYLKKLDDEIEITEGGCVKYEISLKAIGNNHAI